MNAPIPSARTGVEDKLRIVIERLNDRRLREHAQIRRLHKTDSEGRCWSCRIQAPCPTLLIIDGEAV